MEDINLKNILIKLLQEKYSYNKSINILREYKMSGGEQEVAYKMLLEIRHIFIESEDEDKEDIVIELMEIVVGWCHPSDKIWGKDLKT